MRTFFLTVAVSLALGLAASASVAQDNEPSEADIEQAKTAFGEGRSLYDAGDKRGAVAKFKQSYRLSRNALLLYNIGLTYDELGEVDLAIFYYDKFLTDTDRKVANRGLAQKRLTELRKEAERKRAAEAERAASAPKDAEPEAEPEPAQSVERPDEGMLHRIVEDAPPRKPLDITAVIPEGKAWKATLYFRAAGSSDFETVAMEPRYRELVGRIPASKMTGTSVQYFIEMKDDLGKLVASSGKKTSPNIVLIDESAQPRFYPDVDSDDEEPAIFASAKRESLERDSGDGTSDYLLWGTSIGSGALLLTATVSYFVAASAASDLEGEAVISRTAQCNARPCGQFGNFASDLESRGQTFETVYTVTLIGGAALAGVAGYLWYRELNASDDEGDDDDNPLTVVPVIGGDVIGGAAAIRF